MASRGSSESLCSPTYDTRGRRRAAEENRTLTRPSSTQTFSLLLGGQRLHFDAELTTFPLDFETSSTFFYRKSSPAQAITRRRTMWAGFSLLLTICYSFITFSSRVTSPGLRFEEVRTHLCSSTGLHVHTHNNRVTKSKSNTAPMWLVTISFVSTQKKFEICPFLDT